MTAQLAMVDTTDAAPTAVTPYRERFDAIRGRLPGADRAVLDGRRADGMAVFEAHGFPSRRVEAWKYTDLRRLAKLAPAPAPVADGAGAADLGTLLAAVETDADVGDAHVMVFVNGRLRSDLSRLGDLPPGASLTSLAGILTDAGASADQWARVLPGDDRPFFGLNTALAEDGAALILAPDTVVDRPVHLVFVTDHGGAAIAVHPRVFVVAGANSRATVIESHHGLDGAPYFVNMGGEVAVGPGARVGHYRLQRDGDGGTHIANLAVRLDRDAHYDSFTLTLGGDLTRNETVAELAGRGGELRVSGAYLAGGTTCVDNTTLINHAEPDCRSREVFKGVLDDKARGVFQGKIIVQRKAQRTDGYQLNRALLLSKGAEIDAKPELEIYADDVKCSHGATAGEIDHDALFYLRARGIDRDTARALLVEAFIVEAIEEIGEDAVRDGFSAAARARLGTTDAADAATEAATQAD